MTRRLPLRLWGATVLMVALASPAGAATLTITPDKSVYQVGELVVLDVFGDPQSDLAGGIGGALVFPEALATFESSSQVPMTSFDGGITWLANPLVSGPGLAGAFNQIQSVNDNPADCCLSAQVVLRAASPGELVVSWGLLDFFGLDTAPGGSMTIVPEPGSFLLLGLGLIGFSIRPRGGWSHQ